MSGNAAIYPFTIDFSRMTLLTLLNPIPSSQQFSLSNFGIPRAPKLRLANYRHHWSLQGLCSGLACKANQSSKTW